MKRVYGLDFNVQAHWERRAETPEALAARFVQMIDHVQRIDPVFALWTCVSKHPKKFETVRNHYAQEVAAGVIKNDWGEPEPIQGYRFGAVTREQPRDSIFAVCIRAGSTYPWPFPHDITFSTNLGFIPDPALTTYSVFKPALLAIVEVWDPVCAMSCPDPLLTQAPPNTYLHESWIQYLCPWLASLVTPPASCIAEHLPDGGS